MLWYASKLQFGIPQYTGCLQCGADALADASRELQVKERLHLTSERLAVSIPPDFLYARQSIDVEVFHAYHLFQAKLPVRAAYAAGLHSSVRRFTDAEAREG